MESAGGTSVHVVERLRVVVKKPTSVANARVALQPVDVELVRAILLIKGGFMKKVA